MPGLKRDSMNVSNAIVTVNVLTRNASYWTPLDCASFKGHLDVVTTLLEGDSPVNPQDKSGVS